MNKPRIEYGAYLLDMLDARQKAVVLSRKAAQEQPTPEMLAAPVTGKTFLAVMTAEAEAIAALSKRIAVLEAKVPA